MAKAFLGLTVKEKVPNGTKFGERTVVRETNAGANGRRRFLVQCSCGGLDRVPLSRLKRFEETVSGGKCRRCANRKGTK